MTLVLYAVTASAVAWYLRACTRLNRKGRSWPTSCTVSFVTGAQIIVVGASISDSTFTGHMVSHICLGIAGPMLLALGAPVTLGLQTAADAHRARLRKVLHSAPARLMLSPIVGWLLFGLTIIGLYFTGLLVAVDRSEWLHELLHIHLVLVGCVFFWPLIGRDAMPHRLPFGTRLVAVLLAAPFHAFVGLAIVSTTNLVAAPLYNSLADQRRAAALLWISGELMTVTLGGLIFRSWLAADRREAARFDLFAGSAP